MEYGTFNIALKVVIRLLNKFLPEIIKSKFFTHIAFPDTCAHKHTHTRSGEGAYTLVFTSLLYLTISLSLSTHVSGMLLSVLFICACVCARENGPEYLGKGASMLKQSDTAAHRAVTLQTRRYWPRYGATYDPH